MPYLNKKELEARRNGQNPVLATSFVTSHTSTAFTFSIRSIILFSASQRHPAWDIRSLNRPFASVRYLAFITFLGECMELPRKSRTGIPILSKRS